MRYYPLFLSLAGKDLLVVGAGDVGQRKITSLLQAQPRSITILDPAPMSAPIAALFAENIANDVTPDSGQKRTLLRHKQRAFAPEDIEGTFLVFAATQHFEVNALVAAACAERGVLCNIADAPEKSDFFVPAMVQSGEISLAISTGGASPALARRMRVELEAWLGNRYTGLAVLLKLLRPLVLTCGVTSHGNAELFRALVNSSLGEHLCKNEAQAATLVLQKLLPPTLHKDIASLVANALAE